MSGLKGQCSRKVRLMLGIIARMRLSIEHWELMKIKWGDAFEAGGIDAKLMGVRAAFMVRVDAANRAKMMLRGLGIETIGRKIVLASCDPELLGRRGQSYGSAHCADRTGASSSRSKTFGQRDGELDSSAMTGALEGDRIGGFRLDHAATFSSASLTASSASLALDPSGPPP